MSLQQSFQPMAADLWTDLRAREWKAFSFETGHFLLHVPSSHVFEVPRNLADQARGELQDSTLAKELDDLADSLPLPPARAVEVDIRAVSLNMAQGCNLRCTYCFAGEGDYGAKGMMSFDTAAQALRVLSHGKDRFHVIFFGGEPMLNFAVIQRVVDWCEQQVCRFSFAMTTNATLLTEEKLSWLKSKKFQLTISYDGKGIHARQRLNKDKTTNSESLVEKRLRSFAKSLGELREFKLRSTVSLKSLDQAEEALVTTLTSFNYRLALARHSSPQPGLAFSMDDVNKLGAILKKVIDRLLDARDYNRLKNFDNVMKVVRTIHKGKTRQMACGAGVNYLTCSVEGAFYLCHRFNEDSSERYGDIDKGLDQQKLGEIAQARMNEREPCRSCWMREWCAGGCFYEHKMATGDKLGLDPTFCRLQALETEQAMRVYTHLSREAPIHLES